MKKELEVSQKGPVTEIVTQTETEIVTQTESINFEIDSQMSEDLAATAAVITGDDPVMSDQITDNDSVLTDQIADTSEADLSLNDTDLSMNEVVDEAVKEDEIPAEIPAVPTAKKGRGRAKKAIMIPVPGTELAGSR